MKKLHLSEGLIASLTGLGLLESEAKIYAALVLLGYADVGDLIDALDVSKPRIYTSLGTLEERGLIVQTSPRPAIYQAVAPNIALKMITDQYDASKAKALDQFKAAEKQEIADKPAPPLCYVFGNKSLEFKILDMLDNAKESVFCRTSEKYVKYLEKVAKRGIEIHLVLSSADPGSLARAEKLLKRDNVHIRMVDTSGILARVGEGRGKIKPELFELMDLDNTLALIVDDAEVLVMPPLKDASAGAITSTNQVMVYIIKMALVEGQTADKS